MDPEQHRLLTPAEVAALFRVDPRTVARWAVSGRLPSIRTPGGHRRFPENEVLAMLRGVEPGADEEQEPPQEPARNADDAGERQA